MFIKALKEHDEALEVIKFLREDVLGIVNQSQNGELNLAELKDSASKLSAYAHLFNNNALKEFNQLSSNDDEDHSARSVDSESGEWDSKSDDNGRGNLEVRRMGAGTGDRDVGNKLIQAIDKLE